MAFSSQYVVPARHDLGCAASLLALLQVRSTRESSQEELEALLEERLTRMLKCGTTTAEIKSGACHKHGMCCCLLIADTAWLSGYGLDVESEMKMLRVIHNVNKRHPVDCVATFCGAHAVPPDRTPATQTDDVIDNQLPALKVGGSPWRPVLHFRGIADDGCSQKLHAEGKVSPTFIDVFCEKGFFDQEQTARILKVRPTLCGSWSDIRLMHLPRPGRSRVRLAG